ncbi:MAG: thioredoxin domain-containing protein [Actinobacteria bacterium HGW-Actinobacteria-7]|nr:MAG: thioredoxin domain-containing protein [Actinobacteria bacterium HGW-Actinobacteria-7]
MPNRLASETSPYLRQHANNPVDWFPWGDEAFEKARREDKPVFLSVGYSACHWCHVMAHESFEDEATAKLMNGHFVAVKVDREERPDVDAIYMKAVQAMTEHGGWPMSVFLTPDREPFYGGTYYPDTPRHGMPSFTQVLERITELWQTQRDEVVGAGARLSAVLAQHRAAAGTSGAPPSRDVLDSAVRGLRRTFDRRYGGWGGAPKFPQPAVLEFLLRRHLATGDTSILMMVTQTLDAMARGGIYDQLGGGFHRYATDAIWLVPHFEKMLYDNAQLARVYLHAWQVTGDTFYRRIAEETLDYVAREMLDAHGGFYSAQDADSEGEEGRFFVWRPDEIVAALHGHSADPEGDAQLLMSTYGVTERGNFEGANILYAAKSIAGAGPESARESGDVETRMRVTRATLLEARNRRVKPGTDDKVLVGWNGLMLTAFAEASRALGREDYLNIAEMNAEFVLSQMRDPHGRLRRTWKDDQPRLNGYLEDYAHYAEGLLELYQSTFDPAWFDAAAGLADEILAHFSDPAGGFFDTSDDHEELLFRPKETQDGAMPSGGSVAAMVLAKLGEYTGESRYSEAALAAVAGMGEQMAQAPLGFAAWLSALDFIVSPPSELAIVGPDPLPMLALVRVTYRPNLVVAAKARDEASGISLFEGRDSIGGSTTAYLCRHFACERPVTTPAELGDLLG